MQNLNISAITFAVGLIFSTGAMSESMTKNQYKSHAKIIESQYKVDNAACGSLSDNAKDICLANSKGKKNVSRSLRLITNHLLRQGITQM